ncbi:MAG: BrnT family toxin [Methylococcaceae bacterium]|nr:BrnT family toxin [Methylococcaceae bacterium]MDZ4155010.1 BrnT family toxin [Methylococcales bacterium]MDP2394545.1 BrnT family toxin [Methylococcaceae bacterium]MDP3021589.1 BrnT family toxin [Methylococcaceae bacterium]MDP3392088.1 BrnT family toxin [Methylococcaceae bacterium]
MNFEWNDQKSLTCFEQRGFDFAYVLRAFIDPDRQIKKDTRWDYGEDRYQLLGAVEKRIFFVTYTLRGSAIRIISARKANQREVKIYENSKNDH